MVGWPSVRVCVCVREGGIGDGGEGLGGREE